MARLKGETRWGSASAIETAGSGTIRTMRVMAPLLVALAVCLVAPQATGQERHPLIRTATWAMNRCAAQGDISRACMNRVLRSEYVSVGQWMSDNRNSDTVDEAMEICRSQWRYIDLMDNARCARATIECVRSTMNASASSYCLERRLAEELPEQVVLPRGN